MEVRVLLATASLGFAALHDGASAQSKKTYVYDGLGRLTTVVMTDPGMNVVVGTPAADVLTGTAGADHMFGLPADDSLSGSGGDDLLDGGQGINILTGGNGADLASYTNAVADLWVDLNAGAYSGPDSWDVFVELEGIKSGNGNDSVFGDGSANTLLGGLGNDSVVGRNGPDWIGGGQGDDWLDGGDGADRLIGQGGVDYMIGGTGNDIFDCAVSVWTTIDDFASGDRISLGNYTFSGQVIGDYDGDTQADDTLLGFATGNIVVRNISSYSLATWNSLLVP